MREQQSDLSETLVQSETHMQNALGSRVSREERHRKLTRRVTLSMLIGWMSLVGSHGCNPEPPPPSETSPIEGSDQSAPDSIDGGVDQELSDLGRGVVELEGDPERGYDILVNNGYVSCGIPDRLAPFLDLGDEGDRMGGRNELNREMPYYFTKYQAPSGVNLLVANCLSCHASHFNGELIIGLGDVYQDYSQNLAQFAESSLGIAERILETDAERAELTKFVGRSLAIAEYAKTLTRGVNPAMSITAGIMTHLDPETLSWSEAPLLETPAEYRELIVASNPPPWWWYKKKTRMFYSASGGGGHVAWSMLASSMCLDDQAQAEEIARGFPDVLSYLKTIEPPEYPWPIDEALAERGAPVFERECARCHGTYGLQWTYPELTIPLEELGVDREMATRMFEADLFHDWVERSFFGLESRATPELGYVAPPLDGVWATAPYLHNGSVPTIQALLKSSTRPTCWTWSYDSSDYDPSALGWRYQESECHSALPPEERGAVYDTTQRGYGNQGHTYGDQLDDDERSALLEYLKTL